MEELDEAVSGAVERTGASRLNSTVALLVALAATFVALTRVKDRNLTLGMMQAQAKSVDTWNYYQAKSTKQNLAEATLAQAEGSERRYETLNARHDEFDLSDASMTVAIALLGVTALTRKRWLMGHVDTLMSWLA